MNEILHKTPKSRRRKNNNSNKIIIKNNIDNFSSINDDIYGFTIDNQNVYVHKKYKNLEKLLEIEIISKYNHNNILKNKDINIIDGILILTMELQNQTLLNYCKYFYTGFNDKLIIIYKICKGIKLLHNENICDLNINFKSFSISSEGELIFTDFGNAKKLLNGDLNVKSNINNDFEYLSPKILDMIINNLDISYNFKDDIWALGILIMNILECNYEPKNNIEDIILSNNNKFKKDISKIYFKKNFKCKLTNELSKKIVDFMVNILNYNENERYTIDQILNHPIFDNIEKYDSYKAYNNFIFKPGEFKFNNDFREQLKILIEFLNINYPETEIEIFFLIIDIYYKAYTLSKFDDLFMYGLSCIILGFLYFKPEFNIIELFKKDYNNINFENTIQLCFNIILILNGVLYTNIPYNYCKYQDDISIVIDDIIMNKNFNYFDFNWSNWDSIKTQYIISDEPLILKENLRIKDILLL